MSHPILETFWSSSKKKKKIEIIEIDKGCYNKSHIKKHHVLILRNVTPHFENLKYRRIPYKMSIKVNSIRIAIVVCQKHLLFNFSFIHSINFTINYLHLQKKGQIYNVIYCKENEGASSSAKPVKYAHSHQQW